MTPVEPPVLCVQFPHFVPSFPIEETKEEQFFKAVCDAEAARVQELVKNVDPNTKHSGSPMLHFAVCMRDDPAIAKILLDAGASINIQDKERYTALHQSASKGHVKCMQFLLERGARINATTCQERTALHFIVMKQHYSCLAPILDKKPNLTMKDCDGRTALHLAAYQDDEVSLKALYEAGASIQMTDNDKNTPLHLAALRCKHIAMEFLLEKGAYTEAKNAIGLTPFQVKNHLCTRCTDLFLGRSKLAATQIEAPLSVIFNGSDEESNTALHVAVVKGLDQKVKALIEEGADVNVVNAYGETPLHVCLRHQKQSCLPYLLTKAGLHVRDKSGVTPSRIAITTHNVYALQLMIKTKRLDLNEITVIEVPMTSVQHAAMMGANECLEALLKAGADVNGTGRRPLEFAVQHFQAKAVAILLKHGANLMTESGKVILEIAVEKHQKLEESRKTQATWGERLLWGTPTEQEKITLEMIEMLKAQEKTNSLNEFEHITA